MSGADATGEAPDPWAEWDARKTTAAKELVRVADAERKRRIAAVRKSCRGEPQGQDDEPATREAELRGASDE